MCSLSELIVEWREEWGFNNGHKFEKVQARCTVLACEPCRSAVELRCRLTYDLFVLAGLVGMFFDCKLNMLPQVVNEIRLDVLHPVSFLNTMLS